MPGCSEPETTDSRRIWAVHAVIVVAETCFALYLGLRFSCSQLTPPLVQPPDCCGQLEEDLSTHVATDWEAAFDSLEPRTNASTAGRRLVANDFNADFSRRLTFHTWVEEDVALDRRALDRYLRRALAASGLSKSGRSTAQNHRPKSAEALQREFSAAGFAFDTAFAAQAHHMLSGVPWGSGRDAFMRLVRHGLRPNHYVLSLGCGPLATGHHVVRYLLTGRYHCIEPDEYLLRAAVEYEVPAKGLIHKRPRFLLNELSEVAALMRRPPPWLPTPPSHFDFVVLERPLGGDELERTITSVTRYLRPRSGRLILPDALTTRLQRQLGLQPSEQNELLSGSSDARSVCPFSLKCAMFAYNT